MDELAGRLAALEPEGSEALRVSAYFDRLITGGAGLESVARAAAVLAGVPAGIEAEPVQIPSVWMGPGCRPQLPRLRSVRRPREARGCGSNERAPIRRTTP